MNFDELLKLVRSPGSPRLCDDSRLVGVGDVFVAVKGPNVDGHDFITQVLAKGAKYIVCQHPYTSHEVISVPILLSLLLFLPRPQMATPRPG